ncbi:MAG: glutathione S-transferase family protein [Sphingomicrobium sp.]
MTLRLFFSPGACSLVPHIALEEAGADFEPVRVTLAQGEHLKPEYLAINPHARVPALAADGVVVTENIAILNYIADLFGAEGSVPRGDPLKAARCNELLGWFASSVHIAFAQVWRAERFSRDESVHGAIQAGGREVLAQQFAEIDGLCGENWLVDDAFSAADSYALTFFRWGRRFGVDMSAYRGWAEYCGRIFERPAVQRALEREGLKAEEFQPE